MRVPVNRLESLASPAFIAALALLVLNDFALKPLFHNALTGKLSDFAGLFALTLFATTLWPRCRRPAALLIGASFTLWKTTWAEPLIDLLNAVWPFTVGRTVDLTDLTALPMIPLAVWTAPRVRAWPLPRALQVSLALVAPVAFTATSRTSYAIRSTMDVSSAVVVDERALEELFDELGRRYGLRCRTCDPIGEGRAYSGGTRNGPHGLTVNFDDERRTVFFRTIGFERDGRRGVRSLASDIRLAMSERFPGIATIEFTDAEEYSAALETNFFVIHLPSGEALSVDAAERAKRTLSTIVQDIVSARGLRADPGSLVYYAGRRVGVSAEERDLALIASVDNNATLRVRVVRNTATYEALQRAVAEDLATRLDAAFGSSNVTRETHGGD